VLAGVDEGRPRRERPRRTRLGLAHLPATSESVSPHEKRRSTPTFRCYSPHATESVNFNIKNRGGARWLCPSALSG
jgi:hypothetical protein